MSKSSVTVACFHPGGAKDLSAPLYLTQCSYNIVTKTKAGVARKPSRFCIKVGIKPRIMHQEALSVVTCNTKQPKLCGMPPNEAFKCVASSVTFRSSWIQFSAPHPAFLNDVWHFLLQFLHANAWIVPQITPLTVPTVSFLYHHSLSTYTVAHRDRLRFRGLFF